MNDETQTQAEGQQEAEAQTETVQTEAKPVDTQDRKSPLDEAREINAKKEELLKREEALMARKEKLEAERMIGGVTSAGVPIAKKELSDEEYSDQLLDGNVPKE